MNRLKILVVLSFCLLSHFVFAGNLTANPQSAIKEDNTPPETEGLLTIDQIPALINTKPEQEKNLIPSLN